MTVTNNAHGTTDVKVVREVSGRSGHLRLNRPKALNSLDVDMVADIVEGLDAWLNDDAVDQIVISSSHPKAFCAGGDVRAVRQAVLDGVPEEGEKFFRDEYEMNAKIAEFAKTKPYVAIIDGIAMGGGLGVSMHGSHRIVTERASAAMPEMAIGFVPDVGITYFSQHVSTKLGGPSPAVARFAGLTGYRLTAADMLWAGWATHAVPSEKLADFVAAVDADGIDSALVAYAVDPDSAQGRELLGEPQLAEWHDCIEACFNADSWAEIDRALGEADESGSCLPATVETFRELLAPANPESLVAAVELYVANAAADVTLRDALANEMKMGAYMRTHPNFAEGVRAVLVDKDRDSTFDPATVAEVDVEEIRKHLN
jgi:enoyl-CoA hydratase